MHVYKQIYYLLYHGNAVPGRVFLLLFYAGIMHEFHTAQFRIKWSQKKLGHMHKKVQFKWF